ncbi:MAG TPA: peptidoglycan editing factor PgeF [Terracidiphilus sp.]|nr:peptidoglycan editing factor PgeF [Terracidiphilus sp.]
MRTPASSELRSREQIEAIDALIASGALARGSRRHGRLPSRGSQPEYPAAAAASPDQSEVSLASNGVELLETRQWRDLRWLWHGFSTRRGGGSRAYTASEGQGELNLGFTEDDDREVVAQNRQLLAEAVTGDPATPLVTVKQIHSSLVLRAGRADAARMQPAKADGIITDEPGLLLAVMTADCIPVLVADRRRRVVGAFHAGWRGTVKRIVECGVGRVRLEFGSRPEDLVAAIGPGIGACCYAVGEEVQAAFESQFAYAPELFSEVYDPDPVRRKYPMLFLNQRAPGHAEPLMSMHLNLVEANRRQLLAAGLKPERIQCVGGCTNCQNGRFFSYRAERGRTGRMMAVIGIRK